MIPLSWSRWPRVGFNTGSNEKHLDDGGDGAFQHEGLHSSCTCQEVKKAPVDPFCWPSSSTFVWVDFLTILCVAFFGLAPLTHLVEQTRLARNAGILEGVNDQTQATVSSSWNTTVTFGTFPLVCAFASLCKNFVSCFPSAGATFLVLVLPVRLF